MLRIIVIVTALLAAMITLITTPAGAATHTRWWWDNETCHSLRLDRSWAQVERDSDRADTFIRVDGDQQDARRLLVIDCATLNGKGL